MFSYTDLAKSLTNVDIFNLGIRLYLGGGVGNAKKVGIDHWHKYTVKDNKNDYTVVIPIIHILAHKKANLPFEESFGENFCDLVQCSCPYYKEFGGDGVICKHIVAVCQKLQQDFLEIQGKTKQKVEVESILGNIFEVEFESKVKKIMANFESYFAKSETQNIYWFEQFIFLVKKEKNQYAKFLERLKHVFLEQTRVYEQEKKLYYLMMTSLRIGGLFWWEYWEPFITHFSKRQQLRFWSEVWKSRFARLTREYDQQINNYIQKQSNDYKQEILTRLKEDYENNVELWLDFVMSSKYEQFLVDNLSKFDPELLLDICEILPEKREEIEIKVLSQVKLWSDFMLAGDYTQLENVLQKWSILGKSDYFYEATKYIKTSHKKKTKLMTVIRGLEER